MGAAESVVGAGGSSAGISATGSGGSGGGGRGAGGRTQPRLHTIPPLVWQRVARAMLQLEMSGGCHVEGVYRVPGLATDVEQLVRWLNLESGARAAPPLPPTCIPEWASAIKQTLGKYAPLAPYSAYVPMVAAGSMTASDPAAVATLMEYLPEPCRRRMDFVASHLARVTLHERYNKMSVSNLAKLWASIFTRPDEEPPVDLGRELRAAGRQFQCLLQLLTHYVARLTPAPGSPEVRITVAAAAPGVAVGSGPVTLSFVVAPPSVSSIPVFSGDEEEGDAWMQLDAEASGGASAAAARILSPVAASAGGGGGGGMGSGSGPLPHRYGSGASSASAAPAGSGARPSRRDVLEGHIHRVQSVRPATRVIDRSAFAAAIDAILEERTGSGGGAGGGGGGADGMHAGTRVSPAAGGGSGGRGGAVAVAAAGGSGAGPSAGGEGGSAPPPSASASASAPVHVVAGPIIYHDVHVVPLNTEGGSQPAGYDVTVITHTTGKPASAAEVAAAAAAAQAGTAVQLPPRPAQAAAGAPVVVIPVPAPGAVSDPGLAPAPAPAPAAGAPGAGGGSVVHIESLGGSGGGGGGGKRITIISAHESAGSREAATAGGGGGGVVAPAR